jgi:hypothetical protein
VLARQARVKRPSSIDRRERSAAPSPVSLALATAVVVATREGAATAALRIYRVACGSSPYYGRVFALPRRVSMEPRRHSLGTETALPSSKPPSRTGARIADQCRLLRPFSLRALSAVLPVVMTFVAARAVVVAASMYAGKGVPGATDLARADSFNYLSIALHGYVLHPCPPSCVAGVGLPWSGNSGWFPLYPLLLAPFAHLNVGSAAGAVLAGACQFATFAVLWFGFVRGMPRMNAVAVMALTAVFPGAIYLAGVFPLSLLTLLFLVGLWLLERNQTRAVVVTAFLAGLTYPLGCLYGVVACFALRRRLVEATCALFATIVGLGIFVIAQRMMTGHGDAYILAQRGRGHGLNDPIAALLSAKASTLSFLHQPSRLDLLPSVQTVLVAAIVIAALLGAAVARRVRIARWTALLVVLCWAVPIVLGGVSLFRTDVALLPAVVLIGRLPWPVAGVLAMVAAPVAFWMSVLFFQFRLA